MNLLKNYCVIACCLSFLSSCGQLLIEEEDCQDLYSCEELSSSENPLSIANSSSEVALSEISLSSVVDDLSSDALSSIDVSSQRVSSSIELSSSSRFVAVSSVMSSFNEVWDGGNYKSILLGETKIDEWGLIGEDKGAIIFPWSDVDSGGTSGVFDADGYRLGKCPDNEENCDENWNIKGVLRNGFGDPLNTIHDNPYYLESDLKITEFVPSSKESWGWASTGWWIIPRYDKNYNGDTPFDKAKPMGLTEDSWIQLRVKYPVGQTLTIELDGKGIKGDYITFSTPRFSIEGKGYMEYLDFPVKAIKRAGWSIPNSYNPSEVTAVGLIRMEAAMAEGAQFPSSAPENTRFELACFSFSEYKGGRCSYIID